MDFYFDIGMAVILRVLKNTRDRARYYPALVKLYVALLALVETDSQFASLVAKKLELK